MLNKEKIKLFKGLLSLNMLLDLKVNTLHGKHNHYTLYAARHSGIRKKLEKRASKRFEIRK